MKPSHASRTAEFMALFRALEASRPAAGRLFHDPHARTFLGPGLRRVASLARRPMPRAVVCGLIDLLWPGARPAGVARTQLIDDALAGALRRREVDQVVLLGAGFDARAQRLACLAATPVTEVDHPSTLEEKRRRLLGPGGALSHVAIDFERQSLSAALDGAGFDSSRRTFFVWEGVTNYLCGVAVDRVLRFIAGTAPGSQLLMTYVHRDVIDDPSRFGGTWLLGRTLRRAQESWTFGLDPSGLQDYLRARGLRLVWDKGSLEYRARYLGQRERRAKGYEFYRACLVRVPARAQGVS